MTNDWLIDILNKTIDNYNGRKIALWGYYSVSKKINEMIQDMNGGVTEVIYVDKDIEKIDNKIVFSPEILKNKSSEYYVVIPVAYYKSLKEQITDYGYIKDKDYYYFCDCIIEQREDYYEDSHGNKIIGNYSGLHFAFSGFNSEVIIGKKCKFSGAELYIHNNVKINIGDNVNIVQSIINIYNNSLISIGKDTVINTNRIKLYNNSICQIGDACQMLNEVKVVLNDYSSSYIGNDTRLGGVGAGSTWIICGMNSLLKIGKSVTVQNNLNIVLPMHTKIIIGDDCIFSWNVHMISNDGHSIFDVKTKKNINSTSEINSHRNIVIGSHVWIGMNAIILYGSEIGNGSIIGAGSVVNTNVPNNCIAVGVPTKVIRRDIAWSKKNCSDNILDCGEEYINLTEE